MAEESTGLSGAADRLRESAKWVTVSLAAVGGVLVAGLQLSDLGQLEVGSDRFVLAIAGGAVAFAGAVIVLYATSSVLTGSSVSLNSVARRTPAGAGHVVDDPTLLNGHADVAALRTEYLAAVDERRTTLRDHLASPADADRRAKAQAADARAVAVSEVTQALLRVVSYENLAHRWRVAAPWIAVGGALAAAGVGCYAWSANPPAKAVASAAVPNVLTAPAAKRLTLTAQGVEQLGKALGSSCDTKQPIKVLVLDTTAAGPDVVTDQLPPCARVRFILGADWGTIGD
ncbi:hypothetical protein [Dactylosporangium sp. NPDC049140]|uniref:hypothetical protein n=1 Tax=Dactylosporangium sp. NPDC049140 TaxID=3155647 RepID=UPI0033DEBC8D